MGKELELLKAAVEILDEQIYFLLFESGTVRKTTPYHDVSKYHEKGKIQAKGVDTNVTVYEPNTREPMGCTTNSQSTGLLRARL